ncbi:MAG: AraC family ligand binding domain-containing protein [Christensenellales bacterium]
MNDLFLHDSLDTSPVVFSDRILYTPTSFAKTALLYLQEIGSLQAKKPHTSSRTHLSSYLFFCVNSGSGELEYQRKKYKLGRGDCVFIDCQQPYSHSTDKDLWSLSWIHFFGVTMQDIYQKYQERGGLPVFHPENITAFTELHKSLFTLASSDDYIRDMRINSGLNEFLVLLMNESCNPAERSDAILKKQSLDPIREYLDTHYTEKVSLDALADQFFISKFYLTRVFKEQFWLSINTYVLNLRITKAKQMLRFTDKNWKILTTNVALGHHTISAVFLSMSRGITPLEFHEKLGEAGKQPTENLTEKKKNTARLKK